MAITHFCQLCWPMLSTKLQMTRYSASITLPLTSTGSGAPPPTWIKIAGRKPAPFTSCSTRSPYFLGELRGHPLHCVHAQPRALNVLMIYGPRAVFLLDVIARRILGDG